jgi:hypothetical protein
MRPIRFPTRGRSSRSCSRSHDVAVWIGPLFPRGSGVEICQPRVILHPFCRLDIASVAPDCSIRTWGRFGGRSSWCAGSISLSLGFRSDASCMDRSRTRSSGRSIVHPSCPYRALEGWWSHCCDCRSGCCWSASKLWASLSRRCPAGKYLCDCLDTPYPMISEAMLQG